jgi:hypothetical protein
MGNARLKLLWYKANKITSDYPSRELSVCLWGQHSEPVTNVIVERHNNFKIENNAEFYIPALGSPVQMSFYGTLSWKVLALYPRTLYEEHCMDGL